MGQYAIGRCNYGAVCHRQMQVLGKFNSMLTIYLVQMTYIHIVYIGASEISHVIK